MGVAPTFDVAYDPWPSPLAELTGEAGVPVFSGVGMLIEQVIGMGIDHDDSGERPNEIKAEYAWLDRR